ncbi:alpha/beta fold hydrolase [Bdellovibrio bacteriovorus]|uniref:alpha/beta fold hydrolase n=1 Tax=Bdellovibrio bacteriovorus TaxID=959 RepID=UPI0035A72288
MKIISFMFVLVWTSLAFSQETETEIIETESVDYVCGHETLKGVSFKYCLRDIDRRQTQDIVYYLHGLGGSEKSWFRQLFSTRIIQHRWKRNGYYPMVITVSFGKEWLLVNNRRHKLLPFFTKVAMPYLEKKVGGLKKGKRHLIGQSMGGFNALQLALKNPTLFNKVVLLCPAISTISPFADNREVWRYIFRTKAIPFFVRKMQKISQRAFINQKDWEQHDPLLLMRNFRGRIKPKMYLSVGMADGYGFQEGSRELYKLAQHDSFWFWWVPVFGGHCAFDRGTSANFIMGD